MNVQHRTSNIERPTLNENTNSKYRIFNGYSPGSHASAWEPIWYATRIIFSHSTFDVERSMFDVHFFLRKNNLALMVLRGGGI